MMEFATQDEQQLTLPELIKFGRNADRHTLIMSGIFLQKELPVRLSKRVQELQSLPVPMYSTKSVKELAHMYEETFLRIVEHEVPTNSAKEASFSKMLLDIKEKHRMVQANIADGFLEMHRTGVPKWAVESDEIQHQLNKFYTGRIGVRVLIDQHLSLRRDAEEYAEASKSSVKGKGPPAPGGSPSYVGCVQTECKLEEVIQDAVADAKAACRMHLRDSAPVEIDGMAGLTAPYIPEHLYIAVFELLKNAQRATVELHGQGPGARFGDDLPAIRITICGGTDCHIRISDRGGGIPPESVAHIWNFAFSTAPRGIGELAGFGHGLGLSRLYARYWGGDIEVFSLENNGVDCYIRLGVPANLPSDFTHSWVQRDKNSQELLGGS
jgi:pyruvate dehydrogenase kinase 2/3/4